MEIRDRKWFVWGFSMKYFYLHSNYVIQFKDEENVDL